MAARQSPALSGVDRILADVASEVGEEVFASGSGYLGAGGAAGRGDVGRPSLSRVDDTIECAGLVVIAVIAVVKHQQRSIAVNDNVDWVCKALGERLDRRVRATLRFGDGGTQNLGGSSGSAKKLPHSVMKRLPR